jgi:glycosyltransferase involved in cell wall biosynthesis
MPLISIIVPCWNEEKTIRKLLSAINAQSFNLREIEVIIADGISTDGTREIIFAFHQDHPDLNLMVIDNWRRNIPAALNRAIEAASGKYIIRLDAHSIPARDYVERCVLALEAGFGENVGGVWDIKPGSNGWMARSIALAASHPLGVGDARYRVGGSPQEVDTVPFGAFYKSLIEKIGPFDETLLANEDYEFNTRIRKSGGSIWFDPLIRSTYFARSRFQDLAKQYWRYGYWKVRMLLRYPETFRWRQLAGIFVLNWIVLGFLSIPYSFARWLLFFELCIYSFALVFSGIKLAVLHRDLMLVFGFPLAIATMHFSWGSAFLWSAVEILVKRLLGKNRSILKSM